MEPTLIQYNKTGSFFPKLKIKVCFNDEINSEQQKVSILIYKHMYNYHSLRYNYLYLLVKDHLSSLQTFCVDYFFRNIGTCRDTTVVTIGRRGLWNSRQKEIESRGVPCLKAAVVDTARSISTQSKQRIRMRMRDVGGAQPGGRRSDRQLGLHCVGGRSQVLPTVSRSPFRSSFLCTAIGRQVRAHCSAASTLTNQFSAQYHSVSRVFIIISCRPQAGTRRGGGSICATVSNDRTWEFSLCANHVMLHHNFCLASVD